jgi:HSP20 family protein
MSIRWQQWDDSLWPSLGGLVNVTDELENLFRAPLAQLARGSGLFSEAAPAWDIYENKETYIVRADLPGLKKEEIGISIEDGQLKITGEQKAGGTPNNGRALRSERFAGAFERTLTLPTQVNADKITAQYLDGVLTVTLPKAEEAKRKRIEVQAS